MADEYSILSNSNSETSSSSNSNSTDMSAIEKQLKELNATNGKMLEVLSKMSQTNAKGDGPFNTKAKESRGAWSHSNIGKGFSFRNFGSQSKAASNKMIGEFLDGFEEQVLGTITAGVKSQGSQIVSNFAKAVGVEVNQIPKFLGKSIADKYLWNGVGNNLRKTLSSKLGKGFDSVVSTFLEGIKDEDVDTQKLFKDIFGRGDGSTLNAAQAANQAQSTVQAAQNASDLADTASKAKDAVSTVGSAASSAGGSLGKFANSSKVGQVAMKGLSKVLPKLAASAGPYAAILLAVIAAYKKFQKEIIGPSQELIETVKAMASVTSRYQDSRKKNLEYAQKRISADIDSVVLKPFSILEDAANNVYNAWDANVRLITATQGYSKEGLQDLLAAYAERLREGGLERVIPASDLMNNLAKVLESGLSGEVAEEFAYQATRLGAAVPTQDFFSYASTYSSVAANALRNGASQAEAIQQANQSLEDFASNLLYASRELSGGFTTGLQSAESLYEQSVKITQAAGSGTVGQVSGVMTAVAAIVGATAPDLASAITDAVYSAATGGNDSSIVALRSLAGVNASNTEFLKALAQNPKQVFTNIFHNLATMFGATPGAYMEAAEGYAELFGLSAEAFQRVDFEYLAQAIDGMNETNDALSQNMELLVSGQTTLSKEQQVNRQINEYLVNEGLAYVLDNEVAREIQKHMWDEQIAREQMEATYGVEMVGNTLKLFEGIATVINNILMFLNPLKALGDTYNLIATLVEGVTLTEDVKRVLIAGRVGQGNTRDYSNLITSNADLHLISTLPELMGAGSAYRGVANFTKGVNTFMNPYLALYDAAGNPIAQGNKTQMYLGRGVGNGYLGKYGSISSMYNWGTVSKATASAVFEALENAPQITSSTNAALTSSGKSISAVQQKNMDAFLASAGDFMGEGQTYQDWINSAKKQGISSLSDALESFNMTEEDLQNYYNQKAGMAEQEAIREREKQFQEDGIAFWTIDFIAFRDELYRRNTEDMREISQFHADCLARQDTTNKLLGEDNILGQNRMQTDLLGQIRDREDREIVLLGHIKNATEKTEAYTNSITKISNEFSKYYLNKSLINGEFVKIANAEWNHMREEARSNENVDLVNLLAQKLTDSNADLTTPAAQTNALLAAILQVLQAMLTQSANSTGTLSLPDALAALSLGVTQKV